VPIYDYVCESCGHVMEVVHGINAAGPTECPECGGVLAKVFAAPAIHFRGSGWAKKDRKSVSGPVKKQSASDATSSSEPGPGSSAPSDGGSSGAAASGGSSSDGASSGGSPSGGQGGD
jgi:putative FmdB family regulatory protein